jgi:hypothetical protein
MERLRRIAYSPRLAHLVEVNGFFSRLAYRCRSTLHLDMAEWWSERRCAAEWRGMVRPDGCRIGEEGGMSEAFASALIAASASVTGSILAFIVAMRSVRRSVSSSDGIPIGKFVETRLGGVERRLERIEQSLSEVREHLAYQRGRTTSSLWSPADTPRAPESAR